MISLTHFLRHAAWLEWHPAGKLLTSKHVNAIYQSDIDSALFLSQISKFVTLFLWKGDKKNTKIFWDLSIFHLQLFTIYISYADIILKEQFIKLEHYANIIRSLTINPRLLNPVIYKLCMYLCVKAIFFQLVLYFYPPSCPIKLPPCPTREHADPVHCGIWVIRGFYQRKDP